MGGQHRSALTVLPFNRELEYKPHVRLFKHLLQHAIQFFPIAFTCIAVQAVRLHQLNVHFCIWKVLYLHLIISAKQAAIQQ